MNSDECISSTVTPDQFVLDRPTIVSARDYVCYLTHFTVHHVLQVNMSASPSLPSGLTYNCSFSGSGDVFPIEVEAVEVVAGTEYQCDIRGAITDLGSVLAGMETSCHVGMDCSQSVAVQPPSILMLHSSVPILVHFFDMLVAILVGLVWALINVACWYHLHMNTAI